MTETISEKELHDPVLVVEFRRWRQFIVKKDTAAGSYRWWRRFAVESPA